MTKSISFVRLAAFMLRVDWRVGLYALFLIPALWLDWFTMPALFALAMLLSWVRQERLPQIACLGMLPLPRGRIATAELIADLAWAFGLPAIVAGVLLALMPKQGWTPALSQTWPAFVGAAALAIIFGRGPHGSLRTILAGVGAMSLTSPFFGAWLVTLNEVIPLHLRGDPLETSLPPSVAALLAAVAAVLEVWRWRSGEFVATVASIAHYRSRPAPHRKGRWMTRFGLLARSQESFSGGPYAALFLISCLLLFCWVVVRPPYPSSPTLGAYSMFTIIGALFVGGAAGQAVFGPPVAFFAMKPLALRRHRLVAVALGIGVSMLVPAALAIGTHTMSDENMTSALVKVAPPKPKKVRARFEREITRIIGRPPPPGALVPDSASELRYVVSAPMMKEIRRGLMEDIARSAARALVLVICVAFMAQMRFRAAGLNVRLFLQRRNLPETVAVLLFGAALFMPFRLPLWAAWPAAMAVLAGFWTTMNRRDLV